MYYRIGRGCAIIVIVRYIHGISSENFILAYTVTYKQWFLALLFLLLLAKFYYVLNNTHHFHHRQLLLTQMWQ